MAGGLNSPVLNGLTDATLLTGTDIGAKINSFGSNGTLWIPDGIYDFSTPIFITLSSGNHLHIYCSSRDTFLNFTGSGDAIYVNGGMLLNAQFQIDNCQRLGNSSATNAIHLFDTQNTKITNVLIGTFPGGADLRSRITSWIVYRERYKQ